MDKTTSQKTIRERKKAIKERWGHTCAKCLKTFRPEELTMGHLLPESKGGLWDEGNLVPLCEGCNQRDRDRLASYELFDMTTNERLGSDERGKDRIGEYSQRTSEHIRGQAAYNIAFNQRVIITDDIPDVMFRSRIGRLVESAPEYDDYRIALDDPVFYRDGVEYNISPVKVHRWQFEYIPDDDTDTKVMWMRFAFEYREIPKASGSEPEARIEQADGDA